MHSHGYTPHIRPRGEEKKELERNPDFRARRWVVEVTHSFFNRFRKLLVRDEKKADNLEGYGPYQIATRLAADKIEIPAVHLARHGEGVNKNKVFNWTYILPPQSAQ